MNFWTSFKEEMIKIAGDPPGGTSTNDAPGATPVVKGGGIGGATEGNKGGYQAVKEPKGQMEGKTPKVKTNEKEPTKAKANIKPTVTLTEYAKKHGKTMVNKMFPKGHLKDEKYKPFMHIGD